MVATPGVGAVGVGGGGLVDFQEPEDTTRKAQHGLFQFFASSPVWSRDPIPAPRVGHVLAMDRHSIGKRHPWGWVKRGLLEAFCVIMCLPPPSETVT